MLQLWDAVAIGDSANLLEHQHVVRIDFFGIQEMIGNFKDLPEFTIIQSICHSLSEFALLYACGSDVDFMQCLDFLDGGVYVVCDPKAPS